MNNNAMRFRGRARRGAKPPGEMNRLESVYAAHLTERIATGEVAHWMFDAVSLRLADRTFYKPDFLVLLANGELEVHETKGFMEDDAAVKLKVAADRFWWFRFVLVKAKAKKDGGGFTFQEIG